MHSDETCSGSRKDVVVHAISDVGDLVGAVAEQRDDLSKNASSGLRTPRLADEEMTSAGECRVARPAFERLGLVADDADAKPELANAAQAVERVR